MKITLIKKLVIKYFSYSLLFYYPFTYLDPLL